VRRFGRVEDFLAAAGEFLARDEAAHTVIYGVVELLRARPETMSRGPYLGTVERDGALVGTALMLPPNPVAVSPLTELDALPALVDDLHHTGMAAKVSDVTCAADVSRRFTALFAEREAGSAWRVRARMRLYRIDAAPPVPAISGSFRMARAADTELLVQWTVEFNEEAWGVPLDAERARQAVDTRVSGLLGGVGLWEDDDAVVSMAAYGARSPGCARIAPVYTPPERRRRGYGGAVTAALTRHLFDAGVETVVLFTDLANATSNHVYTAIGYRPVADWLHITTG
jgi:RimJ/RimL family protein N-acetyltransferase